MYSKGAIFQAVTNFQNCSNFCANNNTAFGQWNVCYLLCSFNEKAEYLFI